MAQELEALLGRMPAVVLRRLEHYPAEAELARLIRSSGPQALLVSAEDPRAAAAVARQAEALAPGIQVLGAGRRAAPEVLVELMRAGVREYLQAPFEESAMDEAIHRALEAAQRTPRQAVLTEEVFSVLPSRPGVGATTIAVNLSVALSEIMAEEGPEGRVLLADFDLNSGLVGFLLKLQGQHSVTDAASHAYSLDESLWRQLVSSTGTLDVLPCGKLMPGWRIEPAQIRSLLDFVRRYYRVICLDHSGNMEKYSIELLHESGAILLICTAELPSLHLAREKLGFLRSADLEHKVRVILNRVTRKDVIQPGEVEKLLGLPVYGSLPNDYKGVHSAIAQGKPVDPGTELGRQFRSLAQALMNGGRVEQTARRRFVEYFALTPARYSLLPRRQG